jgi:hypothetical protein
MGPILIHARTREICFKAWFPDLGVWQGLWPRFEV